jgi:uncharacterized protein (DUF488 family)
METSDSQTLVLTVGHSTPTLADFLALLAKHAVARLVDVRTVPRSRHNPQFNTEPFSAALADARISYLHMAGLGGFRRARRDSPNSGWRNLSFRGYADYMQTQEFERHLTALMERARSERVALMCAEAVPWRCHRSLIADALTVRGFLAEKIISESRRKAHALTPFAKANGTALAYPPLSTI